MTEVHVQRLDNSFFSECLKELKKRLRKKGQRLYVVLDEVLEKKVPSTMSATDRLRLRDLLVDRVNEEKIKAIGHAGTGRVVMKGRFKAPRHSGKDLAAGAEVEDRHEEFSHSG